VELGSRVRPPLLEGDIKLNRMAERKVLQVLAVHGPRTKRQLAIQAGYGRWRWRILGGAVEVENRRLIMQRRWHARVTDTGTRRISDVTRCRPVRRSVASLLTAPPRIRHRHGVAGLNRELTFGARAVHRQDLEHLALSHAIEFDVTLEQRWPDAASQFHASRRGWRCRGARGQFLATSGKRLNR